MPNTNTVPKKSSDWTQNVENLARSGHYYLCFPFNEVQNKFGKKASRQCRNMTMKRFLRFKYRGFFLY